VLSWHHPFTGTDSTFKTLCRSPFVLSVVAGKTHGPSSTAIGEGLKTAFAGLEAEFIIEARDIIGNQRVVGDDAFQVAIEGPSTPQISVFDRDDGTYLVSYVVSNTGDYVVRPPPFPPFPPSTRNSSSCS
jgi:hypothetical protein